MLPEKPVVTLNLIKGACYLVHCEGREAWPWNIVDRERQGHMPFHPLQLKAGRPSSLRSFTYMFFGANAG